MGSLSNLRPSRWLGARAVVALQGWTIVIVLRSRAGAVRRSVGSAAAQGWTVCVGLVILQLVLVADGSETRLDLVEFRGVHHILVARRKNRGHLLLSVRDAIRSHGVRRSEERRVGKEGRSR